MRRIRIKTVDLHRRAAMDALWLAMRPAMISPQLPTVGAGSSRFSRRFPRPPPPVPAITFRYGSPASMRQKWSHAPWAQVCGLFPILGSPVALPLRRESGNPRPSYAVTGGLRTHGKNGPHAPWGQARGLFPIPAHPARYLRGVEAGMPPPRSINQSQ